MDAGVKNLSDLSYDDRIWVGAKTWNLYLIEQLVPVPLAFVVNPSADNEQVKDHYLKIGLGASTPVAVRSSFSLENSASQSFSGMFPTFLNITHQEELFSAIDKVSESWKDAKIDRDFTTARTATSPSGSVLVQMLIACSFSIFGTYKTEDRQWIFEGCWGLGTPLADGLILPERAVCQKFGKDWHIVHRSAVCQEIICVPGLVGTTIGPCPVSLSGRSCLDMSAIETILAQIDIIEANVGNLSDIELGNSSGKMYVFQARFIDQ